MTKRMETARNQAENLESPANLITEAELAHKLRVHHGTVKTWVSRYKLGEAQGVYHFGRTVRIDYTVFMSSGRPLITELRRATATNGNGKKGKR